MVARKAASPPKFDTKRFELLPLAYIRGMNIENAIVIVDETQNLSRIETRALMTRMGDAALRRIEREGTFIKGLHSIGDLDPDRLRRHQGRR